MKQQTNIAGLPAAWQLTVEGNVQGVGFRPFVYRTAHELGIHGYVRNTSQGATILAEGLVPVLEQFIRKIKNAPYPIHIEQIASTTVTYQNLTSFQIDFSRENGRKRAWIMPDMATCPQCLQELFGPNNRRYLYPFINCTHCGPRYSIIEALPYDRGNTSMKAFSMCPECQAEYDDPMDRRFHAQPNACPVCGPHIEIWDKKGKMIAAKQDALLKSVELIKSGKIIALKGIGGFQLLVDAMDRKAVSRLRQRKHREEKPFALLFPDLNTIKAYCHVNGPEQDALLSPQAPIVLLLRKNQSGIASTVASRNPYLGAMLPCSPLHHILMHKLQQPVVATSGNLSDEPICIDNQEALQRLHGIADYFLVHNRPIVRHVDDSIVREIAGGMSVLRRARGYAPLPAARRKNMPDMLAVGGHLKNTISLSQDGNMFTGQHIGDLETRAADQAFTANIKDLTDMYPGNIRLIVHDKHPDYRSTQYAKSLDIPTFAVQHHVAHIYACMAEHDLKPPVLGFAWDGTGYGDDATIWGGEVIKIDNNGYERIGHLLPFRLPGSDTAIRQSWRCLLGILYVLYQGNSGLVQNITRDLPFDRKTVEQLLDMLDKDINSPVTSSAGRLFDAASSLLGIGYVNAYEGQAAMHLEYSAMTDDLVRTSYPFTVNHDDHQYIMDWRPIFQAMINEKYTGTPAHIIAARFHQTLAQMINHTAEMIGMDRIVLSGGVFQNKLLVTETKKLLSRTMQVYIHRKIPPNDGGISIGQLLAANYLANRE